MDREIEIRDSYAEMLGNITTAVKDLLVQKVMSASDLARQTGIAQPTVSRLLADTCTREWRLEHLFRISYSQGIPLADIIGAAENGTTIPREAILLAGTLPRTPERLNRLLMYPSPAGVDPQVVETCLTATMLKLIAPEVYDGYTSGYISDKEIKRIANIVKEKCGPSLETFWLVFKEECIAAGYVKE